MGEPKEVLSVDLSNPTNTAVWDGSDQGSIHNDDPNIVTVTALTPIAHEGDEVVLRFTRSGDISNVQYLDFDYVGSATINIDFAANHGRQLPRFEAGSDTFDLHLKTFIDDVTEEPETVGIYVLDNYDYVYDGPTTVGTTLLNTTPIYDDPTQAERLTTESEVKDTFVFDDPPGVRTDVIIDGFNA